MQLQQQSSLGEIGVIESVLRPAKPADAAPSDHFDSIPEEALLLLRSNGDRLRMACFVAGALVAGVGLGWAGSSTWSHLSATAFDQIARNDTPSRPPEVKSAGKMEPVRKQATPGAGNSMSKPAALTSMARADDGPRTTAALPTSMNLAAAPIGPRPLMAPAPETRPTTISGWSVLEVRGGTAVLEGPEGVRMATVGDTVPGIGRIDSIVRWGNRWIVATANGLVATR